MLGELINTYLSALAQCAAEEINNVGGTCFAGITVGDSYISMSGIGDCDPDDVDSCGEMWVRVMNIYPSTTTGVAETGLVNCNTSIGLDLEIGALRCFKIAEDGEAPSAEDLLLSNQGAMNDAAAIFKAMVCCNHFPSVIVGQWSPLGPNGGLVGGVWTLAVSLD